LLFGNFSPKKDRGHPHNFFAPATRGGGETPIGLIFCKTFGFFFQPFVRGYPQREVREWRFFLKGIDKKKKPPPPQKTQPSPRPGDPQFIERGGFFKRALAGKGGRPQVFCPARPQGDLGETGRRGATGGFFQGFFPQTGGDFQKKKKKKNKKKKQQKPFRFNWGAPTPAVGKN